ncbi:phosphoribosyl pyrophosphokinase, partial [Hortaea werneckii]
MATLNRALRRLPSARFCLVHPPFRAAFSTSQSRGAISTPSPETSQRTAIVTGSSRGIGKAIALRLARDGYDVCINDIPANSSGCDAVAEEVERVGRRSCVALADISKYNEVEGMIQTSVKKLGELNTMIANAGIAQVKPLLELTEEDFERMFRVNVFGCQNTYKAAAKQLIAQGNCKPDNPGKLIGAASIVAFKPFPLLSHYSASKWAVRGLTQAYAMEMAEHNITVNAYGPGIVGTAMWDQIDEGLGKKTGAKKGDTIKKYSGELIALGRHRLDSTRKAEYKMRGACVFSGSSHPGLVESICDRLGTHPAKAELKKFANGETSVEIKESVREKDIFIVQSGSSQINDNVMELLIMISACKSGSAKSVTAVMPYFPYSRQSKRKTHRGAITARMLANLLNVAGVNHVITIDLHASQMQGFFKCPVDNLLAEPLLAKWLRVNIPEWWDAVVVSKNPGGTKRVTSLADALKLSFGIVTTDRRRPHQQASQNASMYNSAVFESMGPDGSHDRSGLEKEMEDAEGAKAASENRHNATIEQDFARQNATPRPHADLTENRPRRPSGARAATAAGIAPTVRTRLGNSNNETPSSPLARSTRLDSIGTEDAVVPDNSEELGLHRFQTAPGIEQPPVDEDGYEEPGGDDESDERVRDVITGRLIHGHIVDDEISSPNMSARSGSNEYGDTRGKRGSGSSEDEPLPEAMAQSFMSTASTRSRL